MHGDDGTDDRADRANVGSGWCGRQVGAKVELRSKEGNPEEQSQNVDAPKLYLHVLTKTELRQERLAGQANHLLLTSPLTLPAANLLNACALR